MGPPWPTTLRPLGRDDEEIGDINLLIGICISRRRRDRVDRRSRRASGPGRTAAIAPNAHSASKGRGSLRGLHGPHEPISRLPEPAHRREVCAIRDLHGAPGASGAGAHVAVGYITDLAARQCPAPPPWWADALWGRSCGRAWTAAFAGRRACVGCGPVRSHSQRHSPAACTVGSNGGVQWARECPR